MSRIGRLPIKLGKGTSAAFSNRVVTVKGQLGELKQEIQNPNINVSVEGDVVHVTRANEEKETKAAHGLYRAIIHNMVEGVEKGYAKGLIINGVGYKATAVGGKIVLSIGYSHEITLNVPAGIKVDVVSPTELTVKGIDKEAVGQYAAEVKALRKPDPYHAYGIRYKDETIVKKEGKTAGKK